MATGTTKAKERLGKECHTQERSTKEDTLAKEKAKQQEMEKGSQHKDATGVVNQAT